MLPPTAIILLRYVPADAALGGSHALARGHGAKVDLIHWKAHGFRRRARHGGRWVEEEGAAASMLFLLYGVQ